MSVSSDVAAGWSGIQRFTGSRATLRGYLAEELAARPQRLSRAIRLALMAAVGLGAMASFHVQSIYGPYLLWAVAAAPRAMMTPGQAGRLIATEGILLIAAVPLAGMLVEAPWLYLPFFTGAVATRAYLMQRYNLSNAWLLVGVTVLSSFYAVVFDPGGLGWDAASTFAGAAIAFVVILLFDAYLWPDPAERNLLDTLARDLDRMRDTLGTVRDGYFDPTARPALGRSASTSQLSLFLTLIDRCAQEGAPAPRKAHLLALVTLNERLRIEIARLVVLAREALPDRLRRLMRGEIDAALDCIDGALARLAQHVRDRGGADELPVSEREAIEAAIASLNARSRALALHSLADTDPVELSNLASFFLGVQNLARLLEKGPEYVHRAAAGVGPTPVRLTDPAVLRHALKLAAAMAAMLVIALTTQRPDMTAALWTVLIAGMPSHGATLRKMALRFGGVLVGGAIAIIAIVLVTPNFESVLTYMIACFLVLAPCAWATQSSNRINYGASQAGTTFVLVFAGLSPSARIYDPLWRIWGVMLGIAVTGTVFLLLWPDYATKSMLPRLRTLLDLDRRMLPPGAPPSPAAMDALQSQVTDRLIELLGIADDARLEGAHSGVDADVMVNAAGTLRRIAHRLGSVAAGRQSQPPLSPEAEGLRRALEAALDRRFGSWRDYFAAAPFDRSAAQAIRAAHGADELAGALMAFVARVASSSYAEIEAWPLAARRVLLAEIESFRRLVVLAGELDQQFAEILTS